MANVHVNLLFEANTQNAINNINQLGQLLNQISNKTTIGVESGSLNQAAQAARELQVHLGNAVNVNTGKLDLTKLNTSLKQSNQSLSQLSGQLVAAGTTGQQAFVKLANSIASAQVPAFTLGKTISTMMKTMGTAAMWTVAYGAVDAITGAFKGAIDYAKDLNKALTDIAIVSDLTEKQLADFAKTASKAAKDLKTTTTAYAEAALIFYQQGLSGKEVEERANAVIKMAHVTGQTAQTVSDQMTAVWNNFDDGSKSLEYYIDVLTALGAATASSTDEITQGLEKFAAVAETVGLSYEYAASALATVTAQTRQSADVVGTAFKTLFARIQDLELGNTLEDGVTLGSYAQSLAKIGVSALDANGNLREMDDILDDMGAKWDTLTEAQKTATAQSVAGVRQYTQLIALMDNWDTFKVNLEIAEGSEGTLEEQNEKWAKSAEAAGERVKESWNQVYTEILDDKTVIGFTNALADFIKTISTAIDSIGGLGPLLLTLFSIFSNKLIPIITSFGNKLVYNFKVATGAAQKESAAMRASFQKEMQAMIDSGTLEPALMKQLSLSDELMKKKIQAENITKNLVGAQKEEYNMRLKLYESMNQEAQKLLELSVAKEKEVAETKKSLTFGNAEFRNNINNFNQDEGLTTKERTQLVRDAGKMKQAHNTAEAERMMDEVKEDVYKKQLQKQNEKNIRDKNKQSIGISKSGSDSYVDPKNVEVSKNKGESDKEYSERITKAQNRAKSVRETLAQKTGGQTLSNGQLMIGTSVESLEKVTKAQMEYNKIMEQTKNIEKDVANAAKVLGDENIKQSVGGEQVYNAIQKQIEADRELQLAQQELENIMADDSANDEQRAAAKAKVETAEQTLIQSTKELDNETKKLSTDQKQSVQSTINAGKQINQAEISYKKISKALGIADKDLENLKIDFDNLRKGLDKDGTSLKKITNAFTEFSDTANMTSEEMEELGIIIADSLGKKGIDPKKLDSFIQKLKESGHYSEELEKALRGVEQAGEGLDNINTKGAFVSATLGGIGRAAGSLQMAFSSIQMLTRAFSDPDMSGMEKMTTILMGLSMILPMVAGGINLVSTGLSINSAVTKIQTENTEMSTKAAIEKAVADMVASGAISANTAAIWANTIAILSSPVFLIVAVILAIVAAIALLTAGIINGLNKAIGETQERQLENNKVTLESIDANQELAESVGELTDKYKELKATGQSTYETMEDLKKQIPDLIDSYTELENRLGIDLGLERLQAAYQNLLQTGDITTWEKEQERVDKIVAEQETQTAQSSASIYRDKMINAAIEGDGKKNNKGQYEVTIGGAAGIGVKDVVYNGKTYSNEEKAASQVLEDVMGDMWDGSKIKFDMSTTGSVLEGYQKMKEAQLAMEKEFTAEELAHMDTYRELVREVESMSEFAEDMTEAQAKAFENQKTLFLQGEDQKLFEEKDIQSLEDYKNKRNEIIASLQKQYDITEAQAENFLTSSEYFKNYEISLDLFADDGKIAQDIKDKGSMTLAAVQQWYDSLPEQDKTLFMSIDFSQIASLDEAKTKLEEIRKQAAEANILSEVKSLEVDENTFEAYTNILVDNNVALKENSILSKQIALNNLKINKGLSSLYDSWNDISEVLSKGNRNSFEYIEAIGKISSAFKEAFDFTPDTKWIEENLENIKALAEGDVESLQELQNSLAEEMVMSLDIKTSINEDIEYTALEIQDTIKNALNELDTSITLGESTTISDDYLNSLQAMLDNGQLAAEDLQNIMRAKGFEMEITGWKTLPGPTKTITQTSYSPDNPDNKTVTVIEENEEMTVPIINGDDTNLSSGYASKASFIRSNTASTLDTTMLNKNKNSKETKNADEEIERYHEINEVIEDLNNHYKLLSDARERAFGPDKLTYMDAEIAKTKELISAQKQLISEIETNLASDREAIAKYGASTDEYGRITNYDEMMKAYVDAYNNGTVDDEGYEQFISDIEQYEETLNKLEDEQQAFIDLQNQAIDLALEKIQSTVDYTVELTEDALKVIEFQLDNLTDSVEDAAEKFALLGEQMAQTEKQMGAYQTALREVFLVEGSGFSEEDVNSLMAGDTSVLEGKTLTEAQVDAMREYSDSILEATQAAIDYRDSISDTLVTAFEDMNEELDKSVEYMDHLTSMADSYANIIDLMGIEASGIDKQLLSDIASTQFTIAKSTIEMEKAQLEQNQAALAALKEQIDAGDTSNELQEAYDELEQTVREDQQALLDSLASGLEAATALFEKEMDNIISTFEDAMTGAYGTFSAMEESFNQQKELADFFIDDYKKIYELSKLNRDIVKSIDDTDSIRAKERLRDLQAEINSLQESNTEMTQYEVDELRAKYDLRVAEIALEEAQNAKSQVRMSRDSEGNWSYVYTADEAAVGNAEQNYEDKLYAYQELVQNYTDEMLERMISIPREYAEAIQAIYQDQTPNDEERALRISETQEYYTQMYNNVIEQLRASNIDAAELYNTDWLNYSKVTGYKISDNKDWIDSFDETVYAQMLGYTNLDEAQVVFQSATENMLIQLSGAYENYRNNTNATLELALGDMDTFLYGEGGLQQQLGDAEQSAKDAANAAKEMGQANADAFKQAVDAASTWLKQYSDKVDQWTSQNQRIVTSVNNIISTYTGSDGLLDTLDDLIGKYEAVEAAAKAASSGNGYNIKNIIDDNDSLSVTGYSDWDIITGKGVGTSATYKLTDKTSAKDLAVGESMITSSDTTSTRGLRIITKNDNGTTTEQTIYITNATEASNINKQFGTSLVTGAVTGAVTGGKGNDTTEYPAPKVKFTYSKDGGKKYSTYYIDENGNFKQYHIGRRTEYDEGQEYTIKEIRKDKSGKVMAAVKDPWVKGEGEKIYQYIPISQFASDDFGQWFTTVTKEGWEIYSEISKNLKNGGIYTFDTGGYTGSWDSSGRLAMLHQKELVLNADDTVNFLDAVNIVREIAQVIDLGAASQALAISNLRAAQAIPTAQTIEQDVTIHAEFPNATNHSEIEEAFRNLTLTASQFANRKNK